MISIIVPVYNVEKYISNTLQSIINQTKLDMEVIIVNDGSTDNSIKIAKEMLTKGKVVNYKIINKENGGVSSARNRGLEEATGEYVVFLDADDYICFDLIDIINEVIDKQEPDIICWGFNKVKSDKSEISKYFKKYKYDLEDMTGADMLRNIIVDRAHWISTGSAAYKRSLLIKNNIKYSENCINGEDQEFTYKALAKANEIKFLNKILLYYVIREGSISNKNDIKKFDAVSAIKRTYDYLVSLQDININLTAEILKEQHLLSTYVYTLQTCLTNSEHKNIQIIFKEIETLYPGLIMEMNTLMKEQSMRGSREFELFKFKRYYYMLNQWIMRKNHGKSLYEFFQKNRYNDIAIYGMGEMGNRLYEELSQSGINIKYVIDKGIVNTNPEIKVYNLDADLEKVDAIVVSAIFAFEEVKIELEKKVQYPIISLEDVIYEV